MSLFFTGVFLGFLRVMEITAIIFIAVVLNSLIPHAPCNAHVFTAMQVVFAVAIILADRVDTAIERLYAWTAGYFLAFLVVGTTWLGV
jgi:hypothetical protein